MLVPEITGRIDGSMVSIAIHGVRGMVLRGSGWSPIERLAVVASAIVIGRYFMPVLNSLRVFRPV